MLGLFGGLAASVPFQKRLNEPHTEGTINRLHYSATVLIFFGCSLLVTCLGKLILIIKAKYSNLPNKRTLTKVLWLFLISENDFDWLVGYLSLLYTEGKESSQSMNIILPAQK